MRSIVDAVPPVILLALAALGAVSAVKIANDFIRGAGAAAGTAVTQATA